MVLCKSEPVAGILTIALSEADEGPDGEARTRIVWEYNVGGKMRYPIPVISQAVDGVMTLQLTGLAKELGVVVAPVAPGAESSGEADEAADGAGDGAADGATGDTPDDAGEGSEADSDAPVTIDPEEALEIATEENNTGGSREPADEPQGPSVDEAFGDFGE
ncbi:hypothetical protein [Erythrobacter sp. SCSIO 43205]|uniref:hypothetical protein n=1 Tax=Erythrobacter sp. SCSIO 43205 TaxID=2779361 RepID=UPI002104D059|nr:hypothetical protein [Erythrobacter sp. SCSIO 43205]